MIIIGAIVVTAVTIKIQGNTTTNNQQPTTTLAPTTLIPSTLPPTTIRPTDNNRVSVRDYGAQGNGIDDDSKAIQLAEDYASSKRMSVYFPAGIYLCKSPLYRKGNTDWIGEGMYQTVLKHVGGDKIFHLVTVYDTKKEYSHIGFYGLALDGNRSGSTNPEVSRMIVAFNNESTQETLTPSKDVRFIGCRLFNYSYGNMGLHIKGYENVQVKDSIFEDGGSGLYHNIYIRRCKNVIVANNISTGRDGNACIKVQLSPQTVISNNVCNEGGRGVHVQDMSGVSITGNTIKNQTLHGINVSIEMESKSENISITGNTIKNARKGINMSNCIIATVTGNAIQDFSETGISFRSVLDVSVTGNTLSTYDSISPVVYFMYLEAGPTPTRGIITSNWLRSIRSNMFTTTPIPYVGSITTNAPFVTYGFWTNETKTDGIILTGNGFSGNSWTKQKEGF